LLYKAVFTKNSAIVEKKVELKVFSPRTHTHTHFNITMLYNVSVSLFVFFITFTTRLNWFCVMVNL